MQTLTPDDVRELKLKANDVRQGIIRSLLAAGSGHSAGPLDMSDVFTALYGYLMRHDPERPDWPDRDRLLLSCGHIAPVRYSGWRSAQRWMEKTFTCGSLLPMPSINAVCTGKPY
jgi:transketolase